MYLKANIKNVVKKKFQDMIKILTEIDTSFLSYFGIKGLLDKFLKWIANLVKQLSTLICNLFCSFCFFFEFTSTPHSLAGKALEKVVNSIVTAALDELKSEFTIKGKAGYLFDFDENINVDVLSMFLKTKARYSEKHPHLMILNETINFITKTLMVFTFSYILFS